MQPSELTIASAAAPPSGVLSVRRQGSRQRADRRTIAMPRQQQRRRATAPRGFGSETFSRLLRAEGVARSHDCRRGKGIARPEQTREPKQSWRAQAAHAWMWAIATARQVCWAVDSEQAQSRVAWPRAGPGDHRDLDHPVVAWPGVAVISPLPARALLPIVHLSSELGGAPGARSVTRATAPGACSRHGSSESASASAPDRERRRRTELPPKMA